MLPAQGVRRDWSRKREPAPRSSFVSSILTSRSLRRPKGPNMSDSDLDDLGSVDYLAAAMEPGSTAGVLVWENTWAAPFASAARRAGGQLIANGRVPVQAIIASLEAEALTEGA